MAKLSSDQITGLNWLKQADYDLKAAKSNSKERFYATACFLVQQVAEKSLKGYLIFKTGNLIKEHRLLVLFRECGKMEKSFSAFHSDFELLDKYYAPTRYADLTEEPPFKLYGKKEAEEAIASAGKILEFIQKLIR